LILVVGATGYLGFEACRRLRQDGAAVRGLVRHGSAREYALRDIGVEAVHGDLKDVASVKRACDGIHTVVSTATSTTSRRRGDTLHTVDRSGQISLIEAARDAGVRRFVYVSVSPNASLGSELVACKREVEAFLQRSGLEWVILQPSAFMDLWLSRRLGWDFPRRRARIIGRGDQAVSLVSAADVAAFCMRAATDAVIRQPVVPIGGPEAVMPLEVVRVAEQLTGSPFQVQRIPTGVIRAAAVLLKPVAPIPAALLALAAGTAACGDRINMSATAPQWSIRLTSLREYLENLLAAVEER
jgi:NADH dehydrogenase